MRRFLKHPIVIRLWNASLVRAALSGGCAFAVEAVPMAFRWPMRIAAASLGVLAVVAFVREIRVLPERSLAGLESLSQRANAWARERERGLRTVELLLCLAPVAAGLVFLWNYYVSMSWASLRIDEIGSIRLFSSRGPLYAITHYPLPKNHLFFSLINAITPAAESYDPLRARIWSYAAVTAMFAAALVFFFRRRWFVEGAFFFTLMATSDRFVDWTLLGRGYGFAALAALISALALLRYLEDRGSLWVIIIAIATFLGTWTLPFYVLFGGALMVILALRSRDARVIRWGVLTLIAIVVVHLPVYGEVLKASSEYGDRYGEPYRDFGAVLETLRFLVPNNYFELTELTVLTVVAITLLLPVILLATSQPKVTAAMILLALCCLFIGYCLNAKTPPFRTTAFLAAPLGFALTLILGTAFRHPGLLWARIPLAALLLAPMTVSAWRITTGFQFVPWENWRETARLIRKAFPEGTRLYSNTYDAPMKVYLGPGYEVVLDEINPEEFASGRLIAIDGDWGGFKVEKRIGPEDFDVESVAATMPTRLSFTRLWIARNYGRDGVEPPEGLRIQSTGDADTIEIDLSRVEQPPRAIAVFVSPGPEPGAIEVSAAGPSGEPLAFDRSRIDAVGEFVVIALEDLGAERLAIRFPGTITHFWLVTPRL